MGISGRIQEKFKSSAVADAQSLEQNPAILDRWKKSNVGSADYGEMVGDVRRVEARGEEVGICSAYKEGGSK